MPEVPATRKHPSDAEGVKSCSQPCDYRITNVMSASENTQVNYIQSLYSRFLQVNEKDREVNWKFQETD